MKLRELRKAVALLRRVDGDAEVVAIDIETGEPLEITDVMGRVPGRGRTAKERVEIHLA